MSSRDGPGRTAPDLVPSSRPRATLLGGRLVVGEQVVLALASAPSILVADRLVVTILDQLDGTLSLGELREDLQAVGLTEEASLGWISSAMTFAGEHQRFDPDPAMRRLDRAPVPRTSCRAAWMGLESGEFAAVRNGEGEVRIGATPPDALAEVAELLPRNLDILPAEQWLGETFFLRSPSGRVPRTQLLFGQAGVLHISRDPELARLTLANTAAAALSCTFGGTWGHGLVLVRDGRAALVHGPCLGPTAVADVVSLDRDGITCLPAGIWQIQVQDDSISISIPSSDPSKTNPQIEVVGVLTLDRSNELEALMALADLCRHWDQPHMDAARSLQQRLPTIATRHDGLLAARDVLG